MKSGEDGSKITIPREILRKLLVVEQKHEKVHHAGLRP